MAARRIRTGPAHPGDRHFCLGTTSVPVNDAQPAPPPGKTGEAPVTCESDQHIADLVIQDRSMFPLP